MKRKYLELSIILIIMLLLSVAICFGDVYVMKDKITDEVVMLSEQDNIVLNDPNKEIVVIPASIEFYNLTEDYSLYLLKNKKFKINTALVTEIEDKKIADQVQEDTDKAAVITAKVKLIALGFTEDEANVLLR